MFCYIKKLDSIVAKIDYFKYLNFSNNLIVFSQQEQSFFIYFDYNFKNCYFNIDCYYINLDIKSHENFDYNIIVIEMVDNFVNYNIMSMGID